MTRHRGKGMAALALATAGVVTAYAAPAQAACETSFSRSKSFSYSMGDYNTLWASVYGQGSIAGQDLSTGDRIDAGAQATADVRIFGYRQQVAKAVASAYAYYGDSLGGSIDLYVLGINKYHRSWSQPLTWQYSKTQTFFSASQWFFPGGIPVNVTETAAGEVGLSISGGPTTTGIAADVKPWARAYATGSAAVDILVAAFGVSATVDLARLEYPTHAELYLSGNHLDWALRVDRLLATLDGRAWVWVKALFGLLTYEQDIVKWSGPTNTATLYIGASYTDLCPPTSGGGGGGGGGGGAQYY